MNVEAEPVELASQKFVPVCAIGASAGGVSALQGLFRQIPSNLGLAYVVVLHLSPDQPSALSDILAGCTRMPVFQIQDGPILKPDCVYVIPPDRELVIHGDSVTARPFSEPRGRRAPIDMFFRSIAAARGDGVAIVLSGAGSDGALGVQAVKEAGGVIMVQEPAEAGFSSMPQNAIASGVADFVAPLARLAERLAEVARSKEAVRSLDMDGSANDLRRIVAFLRARTGHDFSSYKRATVMRRVLRRMQVCRTDTVADYADYLLSTPEEAKELFSDLLISVTMFFRDPRAFEALERQAIKPLFDDLDPEKEESIRAWVVGCATGEEAYSIAMLLHEEASRRKMRVQFQIFASDLDEGALATAREGRYPRSIEADVSDERLARFFVDEGTHYRVRKELRESVLFATHSVLKEPPFMRLDLITCRNLLIYLERALQQQVCSIFHYGLKPGRFLFLGSAETADSAADLFAPLDRDARIYAARPQTVHTLPILPQFTVPDRIAGPDHSPLGRIDRTDLPVTLHVSALERTAPASVLVDGAHNIVHLSPSAGRFILHSAGPVSNQLPAIVRPELRLDLRLALTRALDGKEPTITHPTVVMMEGHQRRVSMHVAPVPNGLHMGAQALVLFLDGGNVPDEEDADVPSDSRPDEVRRLHAELKAAQEAVAASRAGHEASIQDLRATNEELQSINEEYRSTAEELETSKEELQSINEELHTVNAELKSKLASISVAHSDLQNLTDATEIGTLFLDADLRIKMFTPPIADLFNITKADIGRTVTDFSHRLDYDRLDGDARQVLRQLTPLENEVSSRDARSYVMRMQPYRTIEDRIDGVVVTFFDITDRLKAETALAQSEEKYRTIFNSIDEGFCVVEVILDDDRKPIDLLHLEANQAYERYTGLHDVVGKRALDIVPEGGQWLEFYGDVALTGQAARNESYLARPIGRWIASYASRIGGEGSLRVAVVFNDITERKRAEIALRESEERQAFLLKLSDAIRPISDPVEIANTACRLLIQHLNGSRAQYADLSGARGEEMGRIWGEHVESGVPMPRRFPLATFGEPILAILRSGQSLVISDANRDPRLEEAERSAFIAIEAPSTISVPLVKGSRWIAALTIHDATARDWSEAEVKLTEEAAERTWAAIERARAEAAQHESEARFAQFAEASAAALWIRDADTLAMEFASQAIAGIYGIGPDAFLGDVKRWAASIVPEDRDAALAHLEQARNGEAAVHEFRIRRPSDGAFRWIRTTDFPLFDELGRVQRIGGIAEDVTEAKLATEHQGILLAELQHRVRNILALTRAIAARTGQRAQSVTEYSELIVGRLMAFGRVQALLTRAANISVGIRSIVHDEVSVQAQHKGQYSFEGPDVELSPKAAEVLTLAIHELATNAVKYGALSVPNGTVTVSWSTLEKRGVTWLSFDWVEQGAPEHAQVSPGAPMRRGFGSELIEGRVPYELKGRGTITFEPGGARCHLEFPLAAGASVLETGAPQRATVFGGALDMTGEPDLSGYRVLVVEDDYYLASDAARALQGAGAEVMGPCGTENDARAELTQQRPDAVVLDINLGEGATFKLAEHLKDNGIPFVFTTGYDQDVIPTEFDGVERLEKPLQLRQVVGAVARLLARTE